MRGFFTRRFKQALATEQGAQVRSAAKKLNTEVDDARTNHKVIVFDAAGNENQLGVAAGDPQTALSGSSLADKMVRVGASDLGDPNTASDDKMADFSAPNVDITAPGANIPVGSQRRPVGFHGSLKGAFGAAFGTSPAPIKPPAVNVKGTSFAAPYAAGVAALMVKANPSITPDQIESILKTPRPRWTSRARATGPARSTP